jgi:hypothetical protein
VSTLRQRIEAAAREDLPERCECGGKMEYAFDFGRVFSCCDTCTPVAVVHLPKPRWVTRPTEFAPSPSPNE